MPSTRRQGSLVRTIPASSRSPPAPGGRDVAPGVPPLSGPDDLDRVQAPRRRAPQPAGVVLLPLEARVAVPRQVGDEADDRLAHLPVLQERAEAGEREAGDALLVVEVGEDRPVAVLHREVGQVDADVPLGVRGPVGDRVEDLLGVGHRRGDRVGHGADVPGRVAVDLLGEQGRELVGQSGGDLGGGVGVGQQTHDDRVAAVRRGRGRAAPLFEVGHR